MALVDRTKLSAPARGKLQGEQERTPLVKKGTPPEGSVSVEEKAKSDKTSATVTTGSGSTEEKALGKSALGGNAVVQELDAVRFVGTQGTDETAKQLSQEVQKEPSRALSQKGRIMDPRLLFQELLEKPFVPSSTVSDDKPAWEPLVAKLPPERRLPMGVVGYSHDEGKLRIQGPALPGKKAEVVEVALPFADAARFALAFDAVLDKQYPRFGSDEPKELWVAFLDGRRAADQALKIDGGKRSAFDAARLLRELCPKAKPIFGAKTTMEQIESMAGLARAVMDGPASPMENAVRLEDQALKAQGSSLLMEIIKESDKKAGRTTLLDEILSQPGGGVARRTLPDDDAAVVATLDGKPVTAGEIREMALRDQPAVDFLLPGFADSDGRAHDLKVHVEKKGAGFEWSFYGADKKRGGMRVISGELTAKGLEQFREAVEQQGRYDAIPYKTRGERASVQLTDVALAALDKDRQALEAQVKARGGTPIDAIFPHLGKR